MIKTHNHTFLSSKFAVQVSRRSVVSRLGSQRLLSILVFVSATSSSVTNLTSVLMGVSIVCDSAGIDSAISGNYDPLQFPSFFLYLAYPSAAPKSQGILLDTCLSLCEFRKLIKWTSL
jgi:hypothetical protein